MRQALVYVAVFFSGAAALAYEATWGRLLERVFGVSDLAIATVLAAFFLGLGVGSAIGARFAAKTKRPVLTYGALEVAVAAWALLSLFIVPRLHSVYASLGLDVPFATLIAIRFALVAVVLLPPTILMGATLPVLVHALRDVIPDWSRTATRIYAANTLGAVAGAGTTGLFLVPRLGTQMTVMIAAGASIVAAIVAAIAWTVGPKTAPKPASDSGSAPVDQAGAPSATARAASQPGPDSDSESGSGSASTRAADDGSLPLAVTLAALTGATSLAAEVIWTRVLRSIVQGTTPAFAAMLVNFLVGIVLGSIVADRYIDTRSPRRAFGRVQLGVIAATVWALFVAPHTPQLLGLMRGEAQLIPHEWWIILAIATITLFPLSIAIGCGVPLAWRIAGGSGETAAARAGRVLAWNTLGGLVGSLSAGFVLIPFLGVDASILLLIFITAATCAIALRSSAGTNVRERVIFATGPFVLAVVILFAHPSVNLPYILFAYDAPVEAMFRGPGGNWRANILYLREGRNTTVTLRRSPYGIQLHNDGRPESGFGVRDPGFGAELVLLGGLPNVLAGERRRAMVIGLGAGHSATMLLQSPAWQRVDVVELEEAVIAAARFLYRWRERPFPLDDPRARIIVDDARARLALSGPGTYDAVVSQPSHPWLAGSSALYTREFFVDVRRALSRTGVFSLWVNLFRMDAPHVEQVLRTLSDVFPHVQVFVTETSSLVMIASKEPRLFDAEAERRIAGPDGNHRYFRGHNFRHVDDFLSRRELGTAGVRAGTARAPLIYDDRPTLEFELARLPINVTLTPSQLERSFVGTEWMSNAEFDAIPPSRRLPTLLARVDRASSRAVALERLSSTLPHLTLPNDARATIEGAIAEARGELALAITRYASSSSGYAAARFDALVMSEAVEQTATPEIARAVGAAANQPVSQTRRADPLPLARAAAWRGDQAQMNHAIALAVEWPTNDEGALFRAFAEQGCAGVLMRAYDPATIPGEAAARLVTSCANGVGRRVQAADDEIFRARRETASREAEAGTGCIDGRNEGGAIMHLRRALRANPAHAAAARALTSLYKRRHEDALAAQVLNNAARAARGLPHATNSIAEASVALDVPVEALTRVVPDVASPAGTMADGMAAAGE